MRTHPAWHLPPSAARMCQHVPALTFHDIAAKRPSRVLPRIVDMSKTKADDKALVEAAKAEAGGGGVSLGKVGPLTSVHA